VSKASDGLDLLQESAGRHFHSHVVKVQHRKLEERLSTEATINNTTKRQYIKKKNI
jgi:hypothetical protein